MRPLILALDQGTSSSRAIVFDEQQRIVAQSSEPLPCSYPNSGWVEQDPTQIWESQKACLLQAVKNAGVALGDINAIGITNQRETIIAWDKETSQPLAPAIVWQCRRSLQICETLKAQGLEATFQSKTGLLLDPYFSGTKIRWLLDHNQAVQEAAKRGTLALGTVDSWLIWNLTGGAVHATDVSNASRTLLFNIHEKKWDEDLLELLSIPKEALPEVVPSSGIVGMTDAALGGSIPIAGVCGDQQSALFGQACFSHGQIKNTYGTGCFMLANTGKKAILSKHGLLTTIAWEIEGEVTYALEGSVFIAGALIQWLRDQLGLFATAAETEAIALSVADTAGMFIVPAFVGLGAPHWDATARGVMVGLTAKVNKNHLVRAGLEAIAYQATELMQAMQKDLGEEIKSIKVDGGGALNQFLCQFQADLTGCEVTRPVIAEATALGAALLAGLAVGVWESQQSIQKSWQAAQSYQPQETAAQAAQKMEQWAKAVERAKNWV